MRIGLFVFFTSIVFIGVSQDSLNYSWTERLTIDLDSSDLWNIDRLEYHYVSDGRTINKLDSTGEVRFTQSVRSSGGLATLEPINTMKLVHFSQEQQTLCFFDNTLSLYQDCIDLLDANIINASLICSSSQSDRVWVLDQLNSTLTQVVFSGDIPSVNVQNLAGILDVDEVVSIAEVDERLFLLDGTRGVYQFDLFGSFVDFHTFDIDDSLEKAVDFDVAGNSLFLLINNILILQSMVSDESLEIALPVEGVFDFKIINKAIFLRTSKTVHKFELQFLE